MKYCPECGLELKPDQKFCLRCGKQLKTVQEAQLYEQIEDMIEQEVAERVERELEENEKVDRKQTRQIRFAMLAIVAVCLLLYAFRGNIFFKSFSEDSDAIELASQSVVKLYCFDDTETLRATGSGFAVFDDGIILTNYHVIAEGAYYVIAERDDGYVFEMESIVTYDEFLDIAILSTSYYTGLEQLETGSSTALERGENLVAIGSPLGLKNTVSKGVFSGYTVEGDVEMLQFTASISSGSSGGALFNDAGEVVGITTATYVDGQNLNLSVPIEHAENLWYGRYNVSETDFVSHWQMTG